MRRSRWIYLLLVMAVVLLGLGWWKWTPVTVENEIPSERFVVSDWRVNAFMWANGYGQGGERVRVVYTSESQEGVVFEGGRWKT